MTGVIIALAAAATALAALALVLWARAERLGREAGRLGRLAAQQAAELDQLRGADAAVMERLPDPLILLDKARTVQRANAGARTAFGADTPAVLRHPGLRAAIDRAFASGTPQAADLSLPVPIPREVRATIVPLDPPLADGGCAIVVLSDRTRDRAVERMRADFVANASHELRTPLASLIGFIDTLRGPAADDPPAQARFLGIMAEQAARMNRLIDDLLSLSRIELTEHQPPEEAIDLSGLLGRLVARVRATADPGRRALELGMEAGAAAGPGRCGPACSGGAEPAGQRGQIWRRERDHPGRTGSRAARRALAGAARAAAVGGRSGAGHWA